MFNPVAPNGYRLPIVYLFMADIETCLCVADGPGFVSTSPAFMRSSASHPAGPHGRLAQNSKSGLHCSGAGSFDTICTAVL